MFVVKLYYTISLYNLSLMYYGSDAGYVKLYAANSTEIETAAREAGYPSSDGGHVLMAGMQIRIP